MPLPKHAFDRELADLAGRLWQAATLEELIEVRHLAEGLQKRAKATALGVDVEIRAAEIRLTAERRVGRLLIKSELSHGGRPRQGDKEQSAGPRGSKVKKNRSQTDTGLKKLGLGKNRSARRQKEARVPEKEFRKYLAECRAAREPATSEGVLKLSQRLLAEGKLLKSKRAAEGRITSNRPSGDPADERRNSLPASPLRRSCDESFLLNESLGHVRQLIGLLKNYYGDGPLIQPPVIERMQVERLLKELTEMLTALRLARGADGSV